MAKKKFVGSSIPKQVSDAKIIDEGTPVTIKNQTEIWSEYELSDGNKLRIRPLVMEIRKSHLKGVDGNHQYHIRSSMVIDVQTLPKSKK